MTLSAQISGLMGVAVARQTPLHGGDLSAVSHVTLSDGREIVAKQGPLVGTEAQMLTAIAPFAPQVIAAQGDLLLIEYLPDGPVNWHHLGDILRQLHDRPGTHNGWDTDYAFGSVPILNTALTNWPEFWAQRRLRPFVPYLPVTMAQRVERLCADLSNVLPNTPPRLLHGDLWTGNVHFSGGKAWLIDPACYYGDPEVDLAMLHLFGTPPPAFWQGYGPTRAGYDARQPVYQLWPALVHLRLFGSGYLGMCEGLLARAGY
jgi:fructosamine-3-kinase